MTLRPAVLAVLAAVALLSSACTYRDRVQVREIPVDDSDAAYYDRAFAPSPSREAASYGERERERERAIASSRSNALGFSAGSSGSVEGAAAAETASVETTSVETQELEAAPGTPCYDAAVKAGISNGVCTLVSERKYVLVGEKAR